MSLEKAIRGVLTEKVTPVEEAVKHDRYMRAHGKKASGRAAWAFTTKASGNPKDSEMTFITKPMTLGDAAKQAMKDLNSKEVYVMEQVDIKEDAEEENEMYLRQLAFMKYAIGEIEDYIRSNQPDTEEWWQNKMTKTHSMLKSLYAYMIGSRDSGMGDDDDDMMDEEVKLDEKMTSSHKKLAYDVHKQLKRDDSMSPAAGMKLKADHKMLRSKYGSDWRKKAGINEETELEEKSMSKAQQKAADAALAAKRGDASPSDLVGASKEMYDSMTTKELEDFARTKHKGLPDKVEEGPDYLGDLRRKKEREERKKASQHAGETGQQKMMRKVYGKAMGGLKEEPADRLKDKRGGSEYMQKPGESDKVRDSSISQEIQRKVLQGLQKSGKATDVQKRLQTNLSRNEEKDVKESTAEYGKSLERQRMNRISQGDRDKLSAVAKMMDREKQKRHMAMAKKAQSEGNMEKAKKHMQMAEKIRESLEQSYAAKESISYADRVVNKLKEVKAAPKGYHFTRDGKLKRGDADQDGDGGAMLRSDPLDKQRKKIPPVSENDK